MSLDMNLTLERTYRPAPNGDYVMLSPYVPKGFLPAKLLIYEDDPNSSAINVNALLE